MQGATQSDSVTDCYPLPFGGQSCSDFGEEDPIVDHLQPDGGGDAQSHHRQLCQSRLDPRACRLRADVVVINGSQ